MYTPPEKPLIEYLLDSKETPAPIIYDDNSDEEYYDEECDHCTCYHDDGGSCCDCGATP